MVIAPANTGRESSKRMAVNKTDHTNSGMSSIVIPSPFMLVIVVIKFAEPRILDTPAR